MSEVARESRGAKLTPRTQTIHRILLALADSSGLLEATLEELGAECGVSRYTLRPHLRRLSRAGLLINLESIGRGEKQWRRLRRVLPKVADPPQTTPPNFPYYLSTVGKNVSSTVTLRVTYEETIRLRREQVSMRVNETATPDTDLDALLNADAEARVFDLRHLPVYPSTQLYAPARVPRMPRTTGDKHSDSLLLIKAWKCAVRRSYGKTPQLRPRQPAIHRMRAVAPLVHQQKITPHAWARFRIAQCQYANPNSKKHPVLDMIFSRKTVEKNRDFYESQRESLDVLNKVYLTPSHTKLLRLWETLRLEVASPKYPPGGVATRAIVDRLLPAEEYRRLADMIEPERRQMEAELYRRGAAGEWIW